MKINRYKEKNHKTVGILLFTLACVFLIVGVILYQTYAIYEVVKDKNLLNGDVENPGDIYFAFYKDDVLQKEMPTKNDGYILDESKSSCGVLGKHNQDIKVSMTEDEVIHVKGVTTSRTKCNLYFVKGIYILGKGIPLVTEGDGLYEIVHENIENDSEFQKKEYRYAGNDPANYLTFNDETWRIIGLVNVMTSEEKVEQRVKIIKNDEIEDMEWDSNGKNDWKEASLPIYLNEEYYQNFPNTAKSEIESVKWSIGKSNQSLISEQIFQDELKEQYGPKNVGIVSASDYGFAVSNSECLENRLYNYSSVSCNQSNWLFLEDKYQATITANNMNEISILLIHNDGRLAGDGAWNKRVIRPVVYLKSSVKITSGTGKNSIDAYDIEQTIK